MRRQTREGAIGTGDQTTSVKPWSTDENPEYDSPRCRDHPMLKPQREKVAGGALGAGITMFMSRHTDIPSNYTRTCGPLEERRITLAGHGDPGFYFDCSYSLTSARVPVSCRTTGLAGNICGVIRAVERKQGWSSCTTSPGKGQRGRDSAKQCWILTGQECRMNHGDTVRVVNQSQPSMHNGPAL